MILLALIINNYLYIDIYINIIYKKPEKIRYHF